jgi:PAS domain S-box-containing protein
MRRNVLSRWARVLTAAIRDPASLLRGYADHDLRRHISELTLLGHQAVSASKERFHQVMEAAPNAVIMINAAGQIEMVNARAERMFGYARADMLGRPADMLAPARFRGPGLPAAFFADLRSQPTAAGGDLYGLKNDGSEFPIEVGLNPIETNEGPMVLSAIADISARKRQEERFRLVVEAAPSAMVMIDAAGTIEMVNAQAERVFGYARAEMLGHPVEMLVPERFHGKHPGLRTAFFADPQSRPMGAGRDLYGRRKDGTEFPVEIGLKPIETDEGPMVLSAIVDISARKRLEERFRLVVEAAPNAMVMINAAGPIEMVNAQAERVFGYARAEMLGHPVEMLVPDRFHGKHPGLRTAFFADPRSRPMGAGRDLYGRRKDGSEFPVEIGLNPIETDEGTMVLSAIVDISARKRQEERFRRVVEAAPNAMVMIGAAGQIEMVNAQAERVFGYARAEMLGQPVEMLVPERLRKKHPVLRAAFFADPRSRPMGAGRDLYGLRKDGTQFPVEIGLNPIETDEGPMVLSAIVDIADRVQLEAQLRQAQKMEAVGRLTAGVAHDFNNLLQAMMGGLELLKDRVGTDPTSSQLLAMSIDAAQRGARLTHHLLAFSRIQVLRPSAIDIAALLRQAVAMLGRTLGPSIVIRAAEDDAGLHAFADPVQLEACILNLAINARDAMRAGGTLTIRAYRTQVGPSLASETLPQGDYAVLAVEDTGVGIPQDVLDKVFEPFFTTKGVGEGSGLGLPMVLGFARQSGGDVRITSAPGQGTRVEVFVPRANVMPPEPPVATGHAMATGQKNRLGGIGHVLLVDDAPDVLVTLGAFLEGAGFQVTKAHSADDALRIIASPLPLLAIVTDYAMPGMSGAELMLQVAQIRPELPGLLVTGYPGIEGLDDLPDRVQVLRKPFLRAELLERMRIMLERNQHTVARLPL